MMDCPGVSGAMLTRAVRTRGEPLQTICLRVVASGSAPPEVRPQKSPRAQPSPPWRGPIQRVEFFCSSSPRGPGVPGPQKPPLPNRPPARSTTPIFNHFPGHTGPPIRWDYFSGPTILYCVSMAVSEPVGPSTRIYSSVWFSPRKSEQARRFPQAKFSPPRRTRPQLGLVQGWSYLQKSPAAGAGGPFVAFARPSIIRPGTQDQQVRGRGGSWFSEPAREQDREPVTRGIAFR